MISDEIMGRRVAVVGGGLAGCEAAWQLARQGAEVDLYEMRFAPDGQAPARRTPAHATGLLAELVCSNSLKSYEVSNAHGLLKAEMRLWGSLIMETAESCAVPAGKALAVDRNRFARQVTDRILSHPKIRLVSQEVREIPPAPAIIATGPLTSESLAGSLAARFGRNNLFFYDAIAPIVSADTLDFDQIFAAARYGAPGDYLNVSLDRDEYYRFVEELLSARRHRPHDFEEGKYFPGCLPLEIMAASGRDALRFGPLKPVGLVDPRTGQRPFAVVQLRQEDREGTMYNLVGFQTQLAQEEQRRIFRSLPGLGRAEFLRYGSMHRNTYLDSPRLLSTALEARDCPGLFLAGQLVGVEGYVESAATGLVAGWNCWRAICGREPSVWPSETMMGALCRYISSGPWSGPFQPMNANFGLLPALHQRYRDRRQKGQALAQRSLRRLSEWMSSASL